MTETMQENRTVIDGTKFRYFIDRDYGLSEGFIAEGTESIVYKGVKQGGELRCSCALKFKPKSRLKDFMEREYKILESMQICRSVVRILDVIEDLKGFRHKYGDIEITSEDYFCVVEEYIDGDSLQDYCIKQWYRYNTEKRIWERNHRKYSYREIVKFQNQLLQFMVNLCEIMKFVSNTNSRNGKIDPNKPVVLHCDIKPENIMVTKHGKELVLIDFGRSRQISAGNSYLYRNSDGTFTADYTQRQWQTHGKDNFYAYGTAGYSAPECYAGAPTGTGLFPFTSQRSHIEHGKISVESDIFAFGTTFHECFSIYEICREAFENGGSELSDPSFFNNYIAERNEKAVRECQTDGYCNRDFSGLAKAYHEKIEDIIRKCTAERHSGFAEIQEDKKDDKIYYHNFYELQDDVEGADNIIPSLDRKTDPMVNQALAIAGFCINMALSFLIIIAFLFVLSAPLANSRWNMLVSEYTGHQNEHLSIIADEMTSTISRKADYRNFDKIVKFMYGGGRNDNVINKEEAVILIDILRNNLDDRSEWAGYFDEIMQNCKNDEVDSISEEIYRMNLPKEYESAGYDIAKAIYYVNHADDIDDAEKLTEAYNILLQYGGDKNYRSVISSLAIKLMIGRRIDTISENENTDRDTVQNTIKQYVE